MKHLEISKVKVAANVPRSHVDESTGTQINYNRASFKLGDVFHSVKTGQDNCEGKALLVQFLKEGEVMGETTIHKDCFSLVGVVTEGMAARAQAAYDELD